jgi:hypothetical protein
MKGEEITGTYADSCCKIAISLIMVANEPSQSPTSLLLGKSGHNGDNHIAHDATRVEERLHEAAPAAAVAVQKSQRAKRRFEASVKP